MNANELINILAQSIAQEQFDRLGTMVEWQHRQLTALDEAGITDGRVKSYLSLSNYTCPICGVTDLQPLQRKRLFFKSSKLIDGYTCQTEHCPAKDIVVPTDLVEAIRDGMVHKVRSCPNCGANILRGYRFCSGCGARLV